MTYRRWSVLQALQQAYSMTFASLCVCRSIDYRLSRGCTCTRGDRSRPGHGIPSAYSDGQSSNHQTSTPFCRFSPHCLKPASSIVAPDRILTLHPINQYIMRLKRVRLSSSPPVPLTVTTLTASIDYLGSTYWNTGTSCAEFMKMEKKGISTIVGSLFSVKSVSSEPFNHFTSSIFHHTK